MALIENTSIEIKNYENYEMFSHEEKLNLEEHEGVGEEEMGVVLESRTNREIWKIKIEYCAYRADTLRERSLLLPFPLFNLIIINFIFYNYFLNLKHFKIFTSHIYFTSFNYTTNREKLVI